MSLPKEIAPGEITIPAAEDLKYHVKKQLADVIRKIAAVQDERYTKMSLNGLFLLYALRDELNEYVRLLENYIAKEKESLKCQRNQSKDRP